MIKTSITITPGRKERLLSAAAELGISVTDLLAILMHRSRIEFRSQKSVIRKAVNYQEALSAGSYVIMHVLFLPLCYEYGVSQRLVLKISVSKIYAVMIDLFLDEIVKNGVEKPLTNDDLATNCFKVNYDVAYLDTPDHEYWVIKWDRRLKRRQKKRKRR